MEQTTTNGKTYERLKFIAVILVVLCLLLFAFNQFISWKLKAEFMLQPCGLCAKVNPNQSECVQGCFQVKTPINSYRINLSYLQWPGNDSMVPAGNDS